MDISWELLVMVAQEWAVAVGIPPVEEDYDNARKMQEALAMRDAVISIRKKYGLPSKPHKSKLFPSNSSLNDTHDQRQDRNDIRALGPASQCMRLSIHNVLQPERKHATGELLIDRLLHDCIHASLVHRPLLSGSSIPSNTPGMSANVYGEHCQNIRLARLQLRQQEAALANLVHGVEESNKDKFTLLSIAVLSDSLTQGLPGDLQGCFDAWSTMQTGRALNALMKKSQGTFILQYMPKKYLDFFAQGLITAEMINTHHSFEEFARIVKPLSYRYEDKNIGDRIGFLEWSRATNNTIPLHIPELDRFFGWRDENKGLQRARLPTEWKDLQTLERLIDDGYQGDMKRDYRWAITSVSECDGSSTVRTLSKIPKGAYLGLLPGRFYFVTSEPSFKLNSDYGGILTLITLQPNKTNCCYGYEWVKWKKSVVLVMLVFAAADIETYGTLYRGEIEELSSRSASLDPDDH